MWAKIKNLVSRLFQPLTSSQYFVGIRKFNQGDYKGAIDAFDLVARGIYKTSLLYAKLGEFYLQRSLRNLTILTFYKREYISCIRYCQRALKFNANDLNCLNYIGHSYQHTGQYGAAIKQFAKIAHLQNERADVMYNLAKVNIRAELLEESVDILDDLISENPGFADFYLTRGIAKARLGFSYGAADDYKKALKINHKLAKAILLLGLEHVREQDYQMAYITFEHGFRTCPYNMDLLFYSKLLTSVVKRLSRKEDLSFESDQDEVEGSAKTKFSEILKDIYYLDHRAEAERIKQLELDISYGEHFNYLDPVFDKPCLRELLIVFEKLASSHPDYADYFYKLGSFYLKLGEVDSAKMAFDRALSINPKYCDVLGSLAMLEESRKNPEGALSYMEELLRLRPDSANYNMMFGRIKIKLGSFEDATNSLIKAFELDAKYSYHLFLLGHMLEEQGLSQLAVKCYKKIVHVFPSVRKAIEKNLKRSMKVSA